MTTLLVGIGNPLRRDDAAGPHVVNRFADYPGCRVLVVHQLLPEHADELSRCDRVLFADAAVNALDVQFARLNPSLRQPSFGHICDPAWLLTLCESLYGRRPPTWLLKIPIRNLGFGEGLSAITAQAIDLAVRAVESWLVPQPAG